MGTGGTEERTNNTKQDELETTKLQTRREQISTDQVKLNAQTTKYMSKRRNKN